MPALKKKNITYFSVGIAILLLATALFLTRGGPRQSGGIVLPAMPVDTETSGTDSGEESLNIISITPETVQPAISTLSRPSTYRRTQTVETYWSGGKGSSVSQVAVSGAYTRVDTAMPDGGSCHMLVVGENAAVWYDEEQTWYEFSAADYSADIAQRMLSYETVLDLPVSQILQAEYRQEDGVYCIYVTTRENDEGYMDSYWVSVSSGLLYKAERHLGNNLIYRFISSEPEGDSPEEENFLLPDGSVLSAD